MTRKRNIKKKRRRMLKTKKMKKKRRKRWRITKKSVYVNIHKQLKLHHTP